MKLPYGQVLRASVARGELGALEKALACLAAAWLLADGLDPRRALDCSLAQLSPRALCARDLMLLLEQSAQGRQALRDLGFQPLLQEVEGE